MSGQIRGRPRSETGKRAILKAAIWLLETNDLSKVTAEAIAQRAGVSKSTLYRWWPNKSAVIMDSFLQLTNPKITYDNSLDAYEMVLSQMKKVAHFFQSKKGKIFFSIIAQSQFDQELANEFRERYVNARRSEARGALQAALNAGKLRADIDLNVALDSLYAPIFYRLLVGYAEVNDEFVETLAMQVWAGIKSG